MKTLTIPAVLSSGRKMNPEDLNDFVAGWSKDWPETEAEVRNTRFGDIVKKSPLPLLGYGPDGAPALLDVYVGPRGEIKMYLPTANFISLRGLPDSTSGWYTNYFRVTTWEYDSQKIILCWPTQSPAEEKALKAATQAGERVKAAEAKARQAKEKKTAAEQETARARKELQESQEEISRLRTEMQSRIYDEVRDRTHAAELQVARLQAAMMKAVADLAATKSISKSRKFAQIRKGLEAAVGEIVNPQTEDDFEEFDDDLG
jgi:molecular chaperone GrpE (heat shock protein)